MAARFGFFGTRAVADWIERECPAVGETILSLGADAPTVWPGLPVKAYLVNMLTRSHPRTLGKRGDELSTWSLEALVEQLGRRPDRRVPWPIRNHLLGASLFIVHEDIRRAQPGWEPRPLSFDDQFALGFGLVTRGKELKDAGVPTVVRPQLTHAPPGAPPPPEIRLIRGPDPVIVSGPVGELVLYCYARGSFARDVSLDGSPEKVEKLRSALCV